MRGAQQSGGAMHCLSCPSQLPLSQPFSLGALYTSFASTLTSQAGSPLASSVSRASAGGGRRTAAVVCEERPAPRGQEGAAGQLFLSPARQLCSPGGRVRPSSMGCPHTSSGGSTRAVSEPPCTQRVSMPVACEHSCRPRPASWPAAASQEQRVGRQCEARGGHARGASSLYAQRSAVQQAMQSSETLLTKDRMQRPAPHLCPGPAEWGAGPLAPHQPQLPGQQAG